MRRGGHGSHGRTRPLAPPHPTPRACVRHRLPPLPSPPPPAFDQQGAGDSDGAPVAKQARISPAGSSTLAWVIDPTPSAVPGKLPGRPIVNTVFPMYVWHVFAGPERGEPSMYARCLETSGAGRDIDTARGGFDHDLADDGVFHRLLADARDVRGLQLLMGPPCSTFSVARMRQDVTPQSASCLRKGIAKPKRLAPLAPRQLRSREHPDGVPNLSQHERSLVDASTLLVERTLALAGAAFAGGGSFIIENPVDRHEGPHARPQWRGHAPLWVLQPLREFAAARRAIFVDFSMCAFGSPYQKLTTVMLSPDLHWLADQLRGRVCMHGPGGHAEIAIGFDGNGAAVSAAAAAYPVAFCDLVFEGFRRAAAPAGPLAMPAAREIPTVEVTRAGVYTIAIPYVRSQDVTVVGAPMQQGFLFGLCHPEGSQAPSRDASLHTAECMLRIITGQDEAMAELAAMRQVETPNGMATVRIHFAGAVPPDGADRLWRPYQLPCRWSVTSAAGAGLPNEVAHAVALAVQDRLGPGPALPDELAAGVGGTRPVASDMSSATRPASFTERLDRIHAADRSLVRALRAVEGDPMLVDFMQQCADQVSPPQVGEIPEALRLLTCTHDAPELWLMPFAHRCTIDRSRKPVHRLRAPTAWPDGLAPRCDADVYEPWFIESLSAYLAKYESYHAARLRGEEARRPGVFAADQTAVKPPYRGMFIDFRGGCDHIVPLDPSALAIEPHFDREALRAELESEAAGDAEIAEQWCNGVTFQADMPPWVVIHPNLLNFWDNVEAATDELDGFRRLGWMRGCDTALSPERRCLLPTFPFYAQPRGAVAKKLGSAPRIIIDMGAPRKPACSLSEGRIMRRAPASLNVRAGPMAMPKWQKEVKPTAADGARASAILNCVAERAGLPVYEVAVDWKKWFHQFAYSNEMACYDGAVTPKRMPDGSVSSTLFTENCHVMAMGGAPASGIAQQGSNALNALLLARMDQAEPEMAVLDGEQARDVIHRWMADRSALPHDSYGTQAVRRLA